MSYHFDFLAPFDYPAVLVKGVLVTIELIAIGGVLGVAVGIFGAWARTQGPRWLRPLVSAYVELIRNTPFLIQLFFIFFGLPGIGVQIGEMQAALLAMVINLVAYCCEIICAGIAAAESGAGVVALRSGLCASRLTTFARGVSALTCASRKFSSSWP